eukprot:Nitzschia sp. Nitz4//scaffold224_size33420//4942//6546//NITZ4_007886-RA/size33420-processed-gene-0.8-mRNA-1//-1//CDS//3329542638//6594//frame0
MMPASSSLTEAVAAAASPDEFLDTIPEDQSVGQRRVPGWGAASVASTNSERPSSTTGSKRRGAGSVVSDANAIIEEGGDQPEQPQTALSNKASKTSSSHKTWSFQQSLFCAVLVVVVAAVAVGITFIIKGKEDDPLVVGSGSDSGNPSDGAKGGPTLAPIFVTFPPDFTLQTNAPTPSPSYNPVHTAQLDALLLNISSEDLYFDPLTPQGACRYWLTHSDQLDVTVADHGDSAVIQRYALCVLFESTGGESTWNIPFLDSSLHECDWTGVVCDQNHTVALELAGSNIKGSLPEEIGALTDLIWIDFSDNAFTGTIPTSYMDIPSLEGLELAENSLTGSIPEVGAAPLEYLYLDDNSLTGHVPYWDSLIRLRVQRNDLTSFDERYATSQNLERFKLHYNAFTGTLPQVWDAPKLTYLILSHNAWQPGPIPSAIWSLPSLDHLYLHDAQFTGTLPNATVSNHFEEIWLHDNQLEGTVPSTFGQGWVNLTELLLYDNLLTGHIGEAHCDHWNLLDRFETDCNLDSLTCDCCTSCHGR